MAAENGPPLIEIMYTSYYVIIICTNLWGEFNHVDHVVRLAEHN